MEKILCSGTRFDTEITPQQCLNCALKRQNDCGYGYAMLNSMFDDKERTGIHVTDLTGCLRKSFYEKTQPRAKYVHEKLLLFIGTITHAIFERGLENNEHLQAELKVKGLGIEGTSDIVYEEGRLVDFKTTRWMKPGYLPYGSHEMQLNVYAQMLREMGREINSLAIQYIDMSGPTKCRACKVPVRMRPDGGVACPMCGYIPRDPHLGAYLCEIPVWTETQCKDWINRRREALEVGLVFGDAPDGDPGFLCRYCDFTDICDVSEVTR